MTVNSPHPAGSVVYSERLCAPPAWWLIGAAVAISLIVAIGAWTSPTTGIIVAVIIVVLVVAAFVEAGRVCIVVTEDGFGAGRSWIEWRWVDRVRGVDAGTMASVMHSSHQVGSFLVTRPWIKSGLVLRLADPADPHQAWIVSTRHPDKLAAIVSEYVVAPDSAAVSSPPVSKDPSSDSRDEEDSRD
ncbi:DUF3093 domain-containing protein [Cutibacterium avidum]|uniref:DUF3093 domain-containing protein n=1 Tax=Cutibacterium avidum TaxID=33010 RepID=UPI0002CCDF5F|nr:DUF3093 domain-containing protein [Cutibacterium avidum]AGJ77761.1 hypothetical protein PALO_05755 [Cutibacterium avidum 44067]ERF55986.1 hypothetical protein H639_10170 [Cutibacterium avidum TM16]MCO6633406.1 DUF3093 family protein [Cutibacterium avidum]MCO6657381.1 DUF3093 family protein [Cutibacterium avidum]MCO6666156.1 DUF3093 family protein [Cutibacterium avidum]